MSEFTKYRRSQVAELRPWRAGDDMTHVSVSAPDRAAGSPKPGDMIARNPKNHADQWLVAAQYFADNFEVADHPTPVSPAPGLDLDAVEDLVEAMTRMPSESLSHGTARRVVRASTLIEIAEGAPKVAALITEVRALRATIAKAKRLGLEACALADGGIDEPLDATAVERIGAKTAALAAVLEAL